MPRWAGKAHAGARDDFVPASPQAHRYDRRKCHKATGHLTSPQRRPHHRSDPFQPVNRFRAPFPLERWQRAAFCGAVSAEVVRCPLSVPPAPRTMRTNDGETGNRQRSDPAGRRTDYGQRITDNESARHGVFALKVESVFLITPAGAKLPSQQFALSELCSCATILAV